MTKIPVFYMPEQVAVTDSFSLSPRKPKKVVAEWLKHYPDGIDVRSFEPVTREQLKLVHSDRYVDGVLDGYVCNGFGNTDKAVADSLCYTSGSMLAAGREALKTGISVAPVSGFHHACHNGGGGFCTFEGLSLTAKVLKDEGLVDRVGILDMDYHYGNGTADIISRLRMDYVQHYSVGDVFNYPNDAIRFLSILEQVMVSFKDCDLLLVQCGADPHIDDPLGGFLTTEQLRKRDAIVFKMADRLGLPVAWDLAGGYQRNYQKTIDIHINTMAECLKVYCPQKDSVCA